MTQTVTSMIVRNAAMIGSRYTKVATDPPTTTAPHTINRPDTPLSIRRPQPRAASPPPIRLGGGATRSGVTGGTGVIDRALRCAVPVPTVKGQRFNSQPSPGAGLPPGVHRIGPVSQPREAIP